MKFEFMRNGKVIGTKGWHADHDDACDLSYTGLHCDGKVVALLVVRDDDSAADLIKMGKFIVDACNAYAANKPAT